MRFLHLTPDGQPVDDGQLHTVYAAVRTQATDGTDTLTLTAADPIAKDDRILYKTADGSWAEHIVTKTDTIRADGQAYGTYTCENSLIDIAGRAVPEYKQTTGPTAAMQTALADTGWTLGVVQSNGVNTAKLELEDTDAFTMVEEVANAFDLEVETTVRVDGNRIASRTVNLVAHRGSDAGRTFRYAKDLTEIRRTVGTDHPITRLWVYGKTRSGSDGSEGDRASIDDVNGGKKYLDAPADVLAAWGRPGPDGTRLPYEGTVTFSEVEDPAELLRLGRAQLTKQSRATVSYEGSVVALGHGGLDADNAMIGDTVRIIDTAFPGGLRLEGRILKLERDLLDGPASTTITLGTIVDPITKQNAKVQNTVQQLWDGKGAWDDAANLAGGYLDGVINGLNDRMNLTGGYVYWDKGKGLTVYDKPRREDGSDADATMAIQIGGGYFRIANSRKSDGTWNWRTMGTGGGLVADVIVAGIIKGGSNWWNLETGELMLNDGTIRDGSGQSYWNLATGRFVTHDMTAVDMTSQNMRADDMTATNATIEGLTATNAKIEGLDATNLTLNDLTATNAEIEGDLTAWNQSKTQYVKMDGDASFIWPDGSSANRPALTMGDTSSRAYVSAREQSGGWAAIIKGSGYYAASTVLSPDGTWRIGAERSGAANMSGDNEGLGMIGKLYSPGQNSSFYAAHVFSGYIGAFQSSTYTFTPDYPATAGSYHPVISIADDNVQHYYASQIRRESASGWQGIVQTFPENVKAGDDSVKILFAGQGNYSIYSIGVLY